MTSPTNPTCPSLYQITGEDANDMFEGMHVNNGGSEEESEEEDEPFDVSDRAWRDAVE